jgi:hypothetical protein
VSEREGHIDRQTRKVNRKDRKIDRQDRHIILANFQRQTEAGRQDIRIDRQRYIYRQKDRQADRHEDRHKETNKDRQRDEIKNQTHGRLLRSPPSFFIVQRNRENATFEMKSEDRGREGEIERKIIHVLKFKHLQIH